MSRFPAGGMTSWNFFGRQVELIQLVGMAGIRAATGLGPQFPVDVRMQRVDHGEPRVVLCSNRARDRSRPFRSSDRAWRFRACPIMASQMFPSLSIVIIRPPVGKPGFDMGTG